MAAAHEGPTASRGRAEGERLKQEGMDRAAEAGRSLLQEAKELLEADARRNPGKLYTSDDAFFLLNADLPDDQEPRSLGNTAGHLFTGGKWRKTGQRRKSVRPNMHANENRVWEYIG